MEKDINVMLIVLLTLGSSGLAILSGYIIFKLYHYFMKINAVLRCFEFKYKIYSTGGIDSSISEWYDACLEKRRARMKKDDNENTQV